MESKIQQRELQKAVNTATRFISTNSPLPILSNILIKAVDNQTLFIVGSNMESSTGITLEAKVLVPGAFVVPAKTFQEFISLLPSGEVTLQTDQTKLSVVLAGHSANLEIGVGDSYPELPNETGAETFSLSIDDLFEISQLVAPAAAKDDTRPVLATLLFEKNEDTLQVVATDGYRLSVLTDVPFKGTFERKSFLLSCRIFNEVSKMAKETLSKTIQITLFADNPLILFTFNGVVLYTRLIEGQYPEYRKIVPQLTAQKIVCERGELEESVRLAQVFAKQNASITKWSLNSEQLTISAQQVGQGTQESTVSITNEGEVVSVLAFNASYVLEFLKIIKGTNITIGLNGPLLPTVWKNTEKANFLHIIMPVRLQNT